MNKIIHVDMDYFYAQVEELDRPELKNKPVGVGGTVDGRGVLCTSNYVARKYGVKGAMPTFKALKLCPDLVLIKPDFKKYKKASAEVFKIFANYTDIIQGLSLDEAYLDVTHTKLFNNSAIKIAEEIKKDIFKTTGLTASAGVSYNKLLAKISSDLNKPNGLFSILPKNALEQITDFPVKYINGVGKVTLKKMHAMGIYTFGDLRTFTKLDLINHFGSFGPALYDYARGIDSRVVKSERLRKSLSIEHTFNKNISDIDELTDFLSHLYLDFQERLIKYNDQKIKSVFIKIKYSDFSTTTNEMTKDSVSLEDFKNLFLERMISRSEPIRLVGIGVKFVDLTTHGQLSLF